MTIANVPTETERGAQKNPQYARRPGKRFYG